MIKTITILPKSNRALWEVFKNGRTPEIGEFRGAYLVHMLTVLPSLHRLNHRKVFVSAGNEVTGKNIFFRKRGWGHFFLEKSMLDGPQQLQVVVINYRMPGNTILTRNIRDLVRAVDGQRLYLGRFNFLIGRKLVFLGYFSLTKITD